MAVRRAPRLVRVGPSSKPDRFHRFRALDGWQVADGATGCARTQATSEQSVPVSQPSLKGVRPAAHRVVPGDYELTLRSTQPPHAHLMVGGEGNPRKRTQNKSAAVDSRKNARLLCLKDFRGQKLAYVYFEDESGRRKAQPTYSRRTKLGASLLIGAVVLLYNPSSDWRMEVQRAMG